MLLHYPSPSPSLSLPLILSLSLSVSECVCVCVCVCVFSGFFLFFFLLFSSHNKGLSRPLTSSLSHFGSRKKPRPFRCARGWPSRQGGGRLWVCVGCVCVCWVVCVCVGVCVCVCGCMNAPVDQTGQSLGPSGAALQKARHG